MLDSHLSILIYIFIIAAIWGALVGSFLNVLIIRLPKGEDWIISRSHCIKCNQKLSWWMNIPLFSFLILKGNCHYCKQSISIQYLVVEFVSLIKSLLIAYYILSENSFVLTYVQLGEFLYLDLILSLLLAHLVIDIKHQILPDIINIMLLVIIITKLIFVGNWQNAILGGAIGFFGTFSITYLFYLLRGKIGLGGGDIKLYGIVGLSVGPHGILQNLIASSMLGILIALILMITKRMNKDQPFAFGPAIIIIFTLQLINPDLINHIIPRLN